MAAAWELTRPDVERDYHFHVTVYERSWRLGGKGASGRDEHGRIHDHGIHIWLGFYENAFRMMRECYAEASRLGFGPHTEAPDKVLPHGSFDDAFFPEPTVGVAVKDECGDYKVWSGFLPPMEGLPGTPLDEATNPFTLSAYLARCIGLSKALMHSVLARASDEVAPGEARPTTGPSLDDALDADLSFDPMKAPEVLVESMTRLLRMGVLATAAGVLQGAAIVETFLRDHSAPPRFSRTVLRFLEALAAQTRKQLLDFVEIDEELRRKTEIIDLIMTIAVGLYRDRVLFDPKGLDAINHFDCKEWLLRNGAVKSSVESPFVTGLYDLAFCYRDGDRRQPALAAGQALRGALRMFFSYRGSPFWRMRSGMGEAVFSPLFRVLKARGVTFRFMHELTNIEFTNEDGCERVSTLTFRVAETPLTGFSDDSPLDHFGCWRHKSPAIGNTRYQTVPYRDGKDFQGVVLAMGIDDFKAVCDENFLTAHPPWKKMCERVKTIGTHAAQVWMTKDLAALGWKRGSTLVSAFDEPFETWADMTHTLATEREWQARWRRLQRSDSIEPENNIKSVAYFCGVLPDEEIEPAFERADKREPKVDDREASYERTERIRRAVADDLEKAAAAKLETLVRDRMKSIWPKVSNPLDELAKADGATKGALDDQVIQANFARSDRYTLALPGSLEFRISPLDRTVENMTIAGDWTECGFNEGCIEAAVMSGMLAAHAISRKPDLDEIIGYNHP
jgi:uncharacterized protein with NAD-binding domain and iron-sulfur cluster